MLTSRTSQKHNHPLGSFLCLLPFFPFCFFPVCFLLFSLMPL
jgi:hypothetical protein